MDTSSRTGGVLDGNDEDRQIIEEFRANRGKKWRASHPPDFHTCRGRSFTKRAPRLSVSVATIKRYLKRRRETGQVLPKAIPGRHAVKRAVLQAHLHAQLEAHPHVTREEHCRLFEVAYGITVRRVSLPSEQGISSCWKGGIGSIGLIRR
jgi:hypothetical protein